MGGPPNPPDKRFRVSYSLPNDANAYDTEVSSSTWNGAEESLLANQPTATVTKIELS